jgi:hypothetical protein
MDLIEAVRYNTPVASKVTNQRRCVHFSYFLFVSNFVFLKHQETGKSKSYVLLNVRYYTETSVELIDKIGVVLVKNDFITLDLYLNLLKPTGHVMHQQFNIQQLYALPTLYLCVLYLSENKQRLVPLTA